MPLTVRTNSSWQCFPQRACGPAPNRQKMNACPFIVILSINYFGKSNSSRLRLQSRSSSPPNADIRKKKKKHLRLRQAGKQGRSIKPGGFTLHEKPLSSLSSRLFYMLCFLLFPANETAWLPCLLCAASDVGLGSWVPSVRSSNDERHFRRGFWGRFK